VVGWAAVGAVVFGSLVAVIPVDNPGVQACGPPIGFLLRGEADAYPDAEGRIRRDDGRIDTLTDAERDPTD